MFIALMLVVGRRVFPWLLAQVARTGSRELFRLAVLSIALGCAYGAAQLFGLALHLRRRIDDRAHLRVHRRDLLDRQGGRTDAVPAGHLADRRHRPDR